MSHLERVVSPNQPREWTLQLPSSVASPSTARRLLREVLRQWGLRCVTDDAVLVTSELVGNVVRHGAFPAALRATWEGHRLLLEVQDVAPDLPEPRSTPVHHPGGLGLEIVGTASKNWGVTPLPQGKTVWAELPIE